MKNISKVVGIFCVLLGLVLTQVAQAEDAQDLKIAVIDVARVVRAYPETKTAEAILMKQKKEFEDDRDKLISKGEKLKAEFENLRIQAESKALSDNARREKAQEARALMQEMVGLERSMREDVKKRKRDLSEEEVRLMGRIYEELSEKIEAYVDEHKFTLVINSAAIGMSGSAVLVYSDEKIDITEDIIKLTGGVEEKGEEQ